MTGDLNKFILTQRLVHMFETHNLQAERADAKTVCVTG